MGLESSYQRLPHLPRRLSTNEGTSEHDALLGVEDMGSAKEHQIAGHLLNGLVVDVGHQVDAAQRNRREAHEEGGGLHLQ